MNNPETLESSYDQMRELDYLTKDLQEMTEDQMIEVIASDLLIRENQSYRDGRAIPAEHKILFLIGDRMNDVTQAKDFQGKPIYTKEADFPRPPEISEVNAAISRYDDTGRKDLAPVLSETADIFYNLAQLRGLDPDFKDEYSKWLGTLAKSIGLDLRELLGLAIIKYRRRLIEKEDKDVPGEEDLLRSCIREDQDQGVFSVKKPADDGLKKFYRVVNLFANTVLVPRWHQLKAKLSAEEELRDLF